MNATNMDFKDSVLKKAEKAVSGKAPQDCKASCPQCQRIDLQLLVVTPSVVTEEFSTALRVAKHSWAQAFDAEFGAIKRKVTLPVTRIARPGFLMVFFPKGRRWDIWQVMQYGLTRKIMHQVDAEKYGKMHATFARPVLPVKTCSRKAANFKAQLISIAGAGGIDQAWIAFTDTLWTQTTLERYEANPTVEAGSDADGKNVHKPLREMRGRKISPKDILAGNLPKGGLVLDTPHLEQNVADFVKTPSPNFRAAFALALKPLDEERFGKAAEFADEVRKIESTSGLKYLNRSVILMVPDPVGVVDQLNKLRTAVLPLRQGWMAGGVDANRKNADPERPWKRQSLLNAGFIRNWINAAEREKQAASRISVAVAANQTIDEETYRAIQKDMPTKGENSKSKPYASLFDPAIKFQPLEGELKRYRVIYPDKTGAAKEKAVKEGAAGKIERYNKHLDWHALDAYNKEYLSQEKGWDTLLASRDIDYVTWLTHPVAATTLDNDFDKHTARQRAKREPRQLASDVYDAFCLLDTTARCYGGGGLAEPSMMNLLSELARDESDAKNRVGRALIAKFDLWEKLKEEAGARADFYDVIDSTKTSTEEFKDAWKDWRAPSASPATILALAAAEASHRMEQLALAPGLATKPGLKFALKDAAKKQVIWMRASAYHKYLESGTALYHVSVAWDSHSFIHAATGTEPHKMLSTPSLRVGAKKGKGLERAKFELKRFLTEYRQNKRVTIPIVFDQEFLKKLAAKFNEPMIDIVSHGIFGAPGGVTQIPKSMAEALIVEQSSLQNFRLGNFKSLGSLNFVAFWMQAFAFKEAFEEISKKGGLAQAEAIASTMSAATGMAGAVFEISAMMLAPTEKTLTVAGTPYSAELASTVPKHLRMTYAAGLLTAGGAFFDAMVAVARSRSDFRKGDIDAATYHAVAATSQIIGGVSIAMGSYYTYRAGVLNRVGASLLLQAIGSSMSPAVLARCLTGIGVVFWLAGLAISYYALYLQDDSNELHLRRSKFGTGHPELGKYTSFDDEMQYFEALSIGSNATLEWNDEMSGSDELTAIVTLNYPVEDKKSSGGKPGEQNIPMRHVVRILLEGYDGIKGKKLHRFYEGELPPLKEDPKKRGEGVFTTQGMYLVPKGVKAARLTYMLYKDRTIPAGPIARGDLWIED
jgi:hypothetical protein